MYVAETLPINLSQRDGGQRKEIGFSQACRQVLNLEYLSHIKSTFVRAQPTASSPLSAGGLKWLCGVRFNEGGPRGRVGIFSVLEWDAVIHQETRAAKVEFIGK